MKGSCIILFLLISSCCTFHRLHKSDFKEYNVTRGAILLLRSYDSLFLGHSCRYNGNNYTHNTAMPVRYFTSYLPNSDSQVNFISSINKDTCRTSWNFNYSLGSCNPNPIRWPFDNSNPQTPPVFTTNDVFQLWFVRQDVFQKFTDKKDASKICNFHYLLDNNIPVIPATSIKNIQSIEIEESDGFWAKYAPGNYKSLNSCAGVTVSIILKGSVHPIQCYIFNSYDNASTLLWKEKCNGTH